MQQEKAHHHLPRKLHAMAMTRSTMKEVGDSNPGGVTVRGVVMGKGNVKHCAPPDDLLRKPHQEARDASATKLPEHDQPDPWSTHQATEKLQTV